MSLTNYFGVRRDSIANPVKKAQITDELVEAKPLQKAPALNSKKTTRSRNKTNSNAVLHKTRGKSATKSHKSSDQLKMVQSKLSAHVKFAHLTRKDVHEQIKEVLEARSTVAESLSSSSTEDIDPKADFLEVDKRTEIIPETVSAVTLRQGEKNEIKNRANLELRSLTKSESCPNTPLKMPPSSDKLLKTKEPVKLDASDEIRKHPELRLPFHMERLFELFRTCETIVSTLHNRSEICSFDKIKPAVQEVARCDFTDKTVAQFITLYPSAYSFRYDKQIDRITKLQLSSYTLVFIPNLRTDGTQMGIDSPMKGHLTFTGTRLIQRRQIFYNALLNRVKDAHKKFLISRFSLSESDLPDDASLRRWHPAFALDTAVPKVEPGVLPPHPSDGSDAKITSARDAVVAFRARALFREAKVCEKVAAAMGEKSDTTRRSRLGFGDSSNSGVSSMDKKPSVAELKGISASLLAKVREREKQMSLTLLQQPAVTPSEKAAFAALPATITQIWSALRGGNGRPVPITQVASRLVQSSGSGLSPEEANSRLESLLTLLPDWVEKVEWARPHLQFKGISRNRPLKEVIDEAKAKVAEKGIR
nr:dna replication factor cdt1 [Hymenolepis microstoma]